MPVSLGGGNLNWPAVTFEACFNVDPFDPSPPAAVWTNLTPYVVAWQHQAPSGRQYELARTEAAAVGVLLNNQDGRFDSSNASGAYYPNVLPYRQWRIKAVWSATTYSLVYGYVERWPQRWERHKAWVDLVVVDAFGLLKGKTFRSCYAEEVLADAPLAYYPLGEPSTATQFGSLAPTPQPQAVIANSKYGAGTITPGHAGLLGGDSGTAVDFAAVSNIRGSVVNLGTAGVGGPFVSGVASFSVELWFQCPAQGWNADLIQQIEPNIGGVTIVDYVIYIDNTGKLHCFIASGTSYGNDTATSGSYADGRPHHAVYTVGQSAGTITTKLYVDGVQVLTGSATHVTTFLSAGWVQLGGTVTNLNHQSFFTGQLAHAAVYPFVLTSTQVANHYAAGLNAFAGELSGARFSRLLRYAAYQGPSAVDTGQSQMASAQIAGQSCPQALTDVVAAENGNEYAAGDGTVTFKQRAARWNTTAVATLGEQETPYLGDVRFDFDPTFLYTRVEETRPGGATVAAFDLASQKRYGTRLLAETPQILLDFEATDRANYQLNLYKTPQLRLPSVTIDPASNPALWPVALGTKIGDRLTVKRRPFGAPVISVDCFVEAISHDVDFRADGPPRWRVTYLLSPAGPPFLYWKLDDATFGKLDSGNLIAY